MKKKTIKIIAIVMTAVIMLGSVVTVVLWSKQNADNSTEQPSETTQTEDTSTTDAPPKEEESTSEVPEKELLPSTHVHLKDGNEIYYDELVLIELSTLEKLGKEDEVNQALDWLALIINHYVEEGYCPKTINKIQRFYFVNMEKFADVDFDVVKDKITECFPALGSEMTVLKESVESTFGWSDVDYAFIYESEE